MTPEAVRIRRSLRWSVADGASFFVMMGAAEAYFQAFAVFLKGSVQVGLVSTLPIAVASLLLVAGPLGSLFGSRKRFNVAAALSFGFDTMPPALVHEYTTYLLLFRGAATH